MHKFYILIIVFILFTKPSGAQDYHFVRQIIGNGEIQGDFTFHSPAGIAVDDSLYLYILDNYWSQVLKYNSKGEFVKEWGKDFNNNPFYSLSGVAVDQNFFLYVLDGGNNRVQKYTSDGKF